MKPYTMDDIRAAEHRLGCELPSPIRGLYLVMGDSMCLQSEFYFRALELLRWDGNYLLLAHGVSDNNRISVLALSEMMQTPQCMNGYAARQLQKKKTKATSAATFTLNLILSFAATKEMLP